MKGIWDFFPSLSTLEESKQWLVQTFAVRLKLPCGSLSLGLDLDGREIAGQWVLTPIYISSSSALTSDSHLSCTFVLIFSWFRTRGMGWPWLGRFGFHLLHHLLQQRAVAGLRHCTQCCSVAQMLFPPTDSLSVERWCYRGRHFKFWIFETEYLDLGNSKMTPR